jgi:hypothetical protein
MNIDYIKLEETDTFFSLFEKVSKVHEQLFPDATLESQCNKFDEEYEEYRNAKTGDEICSEYADCYIVAAGIYRFNKGLGDCIGKSLIAALGDNQALRNSLAVAIVTKMNKNIDRKWDNVDGFYKHTTLN